ncbi:UbiD family decarboxylase [Lasiosphaeris hirsuta]|uniref:UbiD family decarboxylase n=1 Tax=Lasiosphaeris hirsuta TaxID=260670 RepID=A0AA40DKV2_9PEZI|nr:UbiD family decarboxylase [Lasiosphaeris hirsuta]
MTFSVLADGEIRALLESLTLNELEGFRDGLRVALHEYSTGTNNAVHQPERTSAFSAATGATTLFMPSIGPEGQAVKVITLTSPIPSGPADEAPTTPGTPKTSSDTLEPVIRPTGAITLFSPQGSPVGILHATTLTAFRTALASLCLVQKRENVRTLTVFGCGDQAFWHVRLTLLLRGSTVRQVNFVNRAFSESAKGILKRLYTVPAAVKAREGWAECVFGVLTPGYGEYRRLLERDVVAADVIFCCTPSTEPLFDGEWLTTHDARRRGRLIVAIGSYTPAMRELPVEIINQATKTHEQGHRHFHKHVAEGGVVVVDTLDGALKEAGELIDAGLTPTQLVELGELLMLHNIAASESESDSLPDTASTTTISSGAPSTELLEKLDINSSRSVLSAVFGSSSSRSQSPSGKGSLGFHRRSSSQVSVSRKKEREDRMVKWLSGGNVIYKSVGLGLMDLTVGLHLMRFAKEKNIGIHVEGFGNSA